MRLQSAITTNTNLLHGLRGPAYLQVIIPPRWIYDSIELGYRGDVGFELLGGCVGVVHDG